MCHKPYIYHVLSRKDPQGFCKSCTMYTCVPNICFSVAGYYEGYKKMLNKMPRMGGVRLMTRYKVVLCSIPQHDKDCTPYVSVYFRIGSYYVEKF